jgi:NO-binding membrane sensor protein with MHYT domain
MGGIATWCMHFISTRAIILGMGEPQIQISYSIGYTALSFFIPVVVLMISFWTVGATEIVSIPRVCLGGILAGLGFSCMVYLGQAGISNYDCIYIVAYIIPSAIIACLASIVALFGLFYYRSNWITTWWKRALSGLIIAVGITGMHWLNIAGTEYQLKVVDRWPPSNSSRAVTVTVVIIFVSCHVVLDVQMLTWIVELWLPCASFSLDTCADPQTSEYSPRATGSGCGSYFRR